MRNALLLQELCVQLKEFLLAKELCGTHLSTGQFHAKYQGGEDPTRGRAGLFSSFGARVKHMYINKWPQTIP